MTITHEDVQQLLDAQAEDAVLVLLEGRTMVLSEADLGSERYLGALRVATRADIVDHAGQATLSEHQRREVAARLDTEVSQLGG